MNNEQNTISTLYCVFSPSAPGAWHGSSSVTLHGNLYSKSSHGYTVRGFVFNLKLRSKWHQPVSMHLSAHHYHQPATTTTTTPQRMTEIGQGEGNGWCFHPFPKPGMYFIGNNICMCQFNCTGYILTLRRGQPSPLH